MTHIQVRKWIEERNNYANRQWWYTYKHLPNLCPEENVAKRSQKLLQQFASRTNIWDSNLNSEWTVRVFYAAKMVLAASVMAQSLEFAIKRNLRAVISYLEYYTVVHSLRAILFTTPNAEWNDGEILQTTHSKTINVVCSEIAHFDHELADHVKKSVLHLKAFRELISYRAPSSGDKFAKPDFDILDYSRCFLEIAQFQSELLEVSIENNVAGSFELEQDFTRHISDVEIEGIHFHDNEDWYRIGYLVRKHPRPTNILHIMSEGHVEDFFGSWCAEEEQPNSFNPDENWRILFDVP